MSVDVIVEGPTGTEWHVVRVVRRVLVGGQVVAIHGAATEEEVGRRVASGQWAVLPADAAGQPLDPGAAVSACEAWLVVEPVEWAPSAEDGRRRLEHLRETYPACSWWLVASVPVALA